MRSDSVEGGPFEQFEAVIPLRTATDSDRRLICSIKKQHDGSTVFYVNPMTDVPGVRELIQAVITLGDQARALHPPIAQPTSTSDWIDPDADLSPRERVVLEGLLNGRRVKELAEELHISVHTVRNHRKAIYGKLGVRSHIELMLKATPVGSGS